MFKYITVRNRKAYFREYYLKKIRPRLYPNGVPFNPRVRYTCVLCGCILGSPNQLNFHEPEIYLHSGYRTFFNARKAPVGYRIEGNVLWLFNQKLENYLKNVAFKCVDILNVCISRGVVSREEIASLFGVVVNREYAPAFGVRSYTNASLGVPLEYGVEVLK